MIRTGGTVVYVCTRHPSGVGEQRYRELLRNDGSAASWGWRVARLNPEVYVRGRISHRDHATVVLRGWHCVHMSREGDAPWSSAVVFLD